MLNLKVKNTLQLLICNLIIILSFSCTYQIETLENIEFYLPKSITAGDTEDIITYTVSLESSNGNMFYNKTIKENKVHISNIPIGKYTLSVTGKDSLYIYTGKENITIYPNKDININLKLTKTKIKNDISNISVKLKENEYINYGEKIDINKFEIKETDETGKITTVTDYSNYTISPEKAEKVGNITVTVKHKNNTDLKKEVLVPCKIELGTPVIELSHTGTISLAKDETAPDIEATVKPSNKMPIECYEETEISWKNKNGEIVSSGKSFTPVTTATGTEDYTFSVTYKIKPEMKDFCIGNTSATATSSVTVKVTETAQIDAITGIKVELKNPDDFVKYSEKGEKININKFKITEVYNSGSTAIVSDYSKYTISSDSTTSRVGNITVTIKNTKSPEIKNTCVIPCKFTLTKPNVSLDKAGPVELTQGQTGNNTIKATATYNPKMPDGTFNVAYEWLKKNSSYVYTKTNITTPTFTIPVDAAGEKAYKCKVTVTPTKEYADFCTNSTVEASSPEIKVTVKAAGGGDSGAGGDTPIPADAVTTFEQLKAKVTAQGYDKTIIIGGNITMAETLAITGNTIIKAAKPVTLTRGSTNTGALFAVGPNGAKLTLGDVNNKITLDGNNIAGTDSLITVPEGSRTEINNCILQNNKENGHGGGAIYNKQGTVTINNSTIKNNESQQNGGGIYIYNGKATLTDVIVSDNTSHNWGGGIAVTMNSSSLEINGTTSSITRNKASDSTGKGGGIYLGGGSCKLSAGSIKDNNAYSGGGNNLCIASNTSGIAFNDKRITSGKSIDTEVTPATDITQL